MPPTPCMDTAHLWSGPTAPGDGTVPTLLNTALQSLRPPQSPLPCSRLCTKNRSLPAHLGGQASSLVSLLQGSPQAFLHPLHSRSRPLSSGHGRASGGEHRGPQDALRRSTESSLPKRKQVKVARNPFLVEVPLEQSEGSTLVPGHWHAARADPGKATRPSSIVPTSQMRKARLREILELA